MNLLIYSRVCNTTLLVTYDNALFGNESSESLLEAYGIIPKGQQIEQLRPKQCPNCSEPNKPDSKFCAKCRMVLTYDAYSETLEKQQEKDSEVQILKRKLNKTWMLCVER